MPPPRTDTKFMSIGVNSKMSTIEFLACNVPCFTPVKKTSENLSKMTQSPLPILRATFLPFPLKHITLLRPPRVRTTLNRPLLRSACCNIMPTGSSKSSAVNLDFNSAGACYMLQRNPACFNPEKIGLYSGHKVRLLYLPSPRLFSEKDPLFLIWYPCCDWK